MARRIILISSFPVCIALAVLAVVFVGMGKQQLAVSSVESPEGDLSEDTTVDNLIAGYNMNINLASNLVNTAGNYAWNRKYDDSERLYRAVADRQPEDRWGVKAQLGLTRLEILNLIEQKQ